MIRAVFFDAVGTLIEPAPAAVEVYHTVACKHGSRLSLEMIRSRFASAFRREDALDRAAEWRTDEAREERRWRSIVASVLDDLRDGEPCFQELWQHFAEPESWRCLPGVEETLAELARRGYQLGLASNFDSRLRAVKEGIAALTPLHCLVISSEIGWRKPARAFFERVVTEADVAPGEILFVGDDPVNDDEGARAAGLRVLLLDPHGGPERLTRLNDLLERVP
jgi:putative hydrolase of the HAD superfamily